MPVLNPFIKIKPLITPKKRKQTIGTNLLLVLLLKIPNSNKIFTIMVIGITYGSMAMLFLNAKKTSTPKRININKLMISTGNTSDFVSLLY